jgi:transcriptional regulator with XRE-family HTH domain
MTVNTTLQKLSYVLRFYRRRKSISQNDMSELLGISTRNYQRLELGEVEPKLETLSKISKILDVPMATFFDLGSVTLLSMNEFLTREEVISAGEISKENNYSDLNYVGNLIEKDKMQKFENEPKLQIQMQGTYALLNDTFASFAKTKSTKINVDEILIRGSVVDRWEMAYRLKLKSAMYENYYILPVGFKAFQIYHFNLNPNPDNPTSDCYLRDITDRYNLEAWMKSIVTNNAPISLNS